ncbi:MAG: outer membrane beta-barrel protein [Bacteroidales bacterium]|nr:outer membrane beta-barrel protein [Bacteroidales bacterium]
MKNKFLLFVLLSLFCSEAFGQKITAKLLDESNGDPLGFATVSLTRDGVSKPSKYVLSSENGDFTIESVRKGKYLLKIELLGYITLARELEVKDEDINLGELKLHVDSQQLDAASVSAVGNPVIIKKDTIEYNASSFRTNDNDVLEDLLKKLPGVEVSESGAITVNGESVSKITIDGKTFFLNDPQIASTNIPAKLVNKLKVIKKKSEQAEFTGIDDGQEETVIDLSVQPGMMQGLIGNVQAGVGADLPSQSAVKSQVRYQGNAMIAKFTDNLQVTLILNGNNTNGNGANNRAMSMMGGMMGGRGMMGRGSGGFGGRNGVTTSYGAGLNVAGNAFDDRMEAGGNYFFNWSNNDVIENSDKISYYKDYNLLSNSEGLSNTKTGGHRIGLRIEHKFSENTSILFEPDINFGNGSYLQTNTTNSYRNTLNDKINDANSLTSGNNKSVSANGFLLFRQRLGIPGRTLTANVNFNISNNKLDEINQSTTNDYTTGTAAPIKVDQTSNSLQESYNIRTDLTYTEPLGNNFYIQASYNYSYIKSVSDKQTYDLLNGGVMDYNYSNKIVNLSSEHRIGVNALYQNDKYHAQIGLAAMPNYTYNSTTSFDASTGMYAPKEYSDNRWNFSPQVMFFGEPNDKLNFRFFYRGTSSQPSTSQLMPVPDNSNPLSIRFGNPNLTPYFSHNINSDIRFSDREKYTSFNIRINGGFTQNPIVNTMWVGSNGVEYNMPFNGPMSANAGFNMFASIPFGKSDFSMSARLGANWSTRSSYVGTNIDMSTYDKDGFYKFMEEFYQNFNNPTYYDQHIAKNTTNTLSSNGNLRLIYRGKAIEASLQGSTRVNRSWYSISTVADQTTTWNNLIGGEIEWNWNLAGMELSLEGNYNWYNGYASEQPSQFILNAEILKNFGNFTLALRGTDILGQSKNLTVTDNSNYHLETVNNTLGRYVILAFTWRFGSMGNRRGMMGGPGGMPRMPMGGGPGGPGPRMMR